MLQTSDTDNATGDCTLTDSVLTLENVSPQQQAALLRIAIDQGFTSVTELVQALADGKMTAVSTATSDTAARDAEITWLQNRVKRLQKVIETLLKFR